LLQGVRHPLFLRAAVASRRVQHQRPMPRRRRSDLVRRRHVRRAKLGSKRPHHSMKRRAKATSREAGIDPARAKEIGGLLLRWYRANRRDLPWRRTKDPYAIWVSEAMLQQTQVATVKAYYERWMKRFPTVLALADSAESDVLHAWQGLGYYSRARNLRAG